MRPNPVRRHMKTGKELIKIELLFLTFALGFIASSCWFFAPSWWCGAIVVSILLVVMGRYWGGIRQQKVYAVVMFAGLGLLLSAVFAAQFILRALPSSVAQQLITVEARISGLVERDGFVADSGEPRARIRFLAEVELVDIGARRLQLRWYDPPEVRSGERWQLTIKIKPPHGFASPGAFDFEAWATNQGVDGFGYVRDGERLSVAQPTRLEQLREDLYRWVDQGVSEAHQGVVTALLLGEKRQINDEQWQLFNSTGTTHLVVISGLHIGLMAGAGFALARWLARVGVFPLRLLPLPVWRGLLAAMFALFYGVLASGGVPVQRALLMTFVALLAPIFGLKSSGFFLWCAALVGVLLWQPLAFIGHGFWLSFVAVGLLLLAVRGVHGHSTKWRDGWRPQWWIFVGLSPLLLVMGQGVSVWSPLINAVAIPWVGMVIVPLLLFAALLHSDTLLAVVDTLVGWWLAALEQVAPWSWSLSANPVAGVVVLLAMLLFSAMVLLPSAWRLRWLAPFFLLPWWRPPPLLPADEAQVDVLDVGQGLAVVVRTRSHTLVYDTGDRFSPTHSAADRVIIPLLQRAGVERLDRIIISHGDRDHSGGLAGLLERFPNTSLTVGSAVEGWPSSLPFCQAGERWQWDGVQFEMLAGGVGRKSNDASCVLKVSAGKHSLLLPGDISGSVERELLQYASSLSATVLVASHHGSKYSNRADFLQAVQPLWVVVSAGFANRFNHPAPQALARFEQVGAQVLTTSQGGTVSFRLGNAPLEVTGYRQQPRYWWYAGN